MTKQNKFNVFIYVNIFVDTATYMQNATVYH